MRSPCPAEVLQEITEHYNTYRPHLDQQPPPAALPYAPGATIQSLRRDQLGGPVHEYVQVA